MDTTIRMHDSLQRVRLVLGVFKLRIGFVITFTAMAGFAITPGTGASATRVAVLALAILVSSASAGAFNQYFEFEADRLMRRTRGRAFATGELARTRAWPVAIFVMLAASVVAAWYATNALAATYVFLGAFFYAFVYTVWLKRRSWLNVPIGGLAGSFAVLAGAAAANPEFGAAPVLLAVVLFLWTPPHFWSLAIANRSDYAAAGVPMLPVVVGERRAARIVFDCTVVLAVVSLAPFWFGAGPVYLAGALAGGAHFIRRTWRLARSPGRDSAMVAFHASLTQLSVLLSAAILDAAIF